MPPIKFLNETESDSRYAGSAPVSQNAADIANLQTKANDNETRSQDNAADIALFPTPTEFADLQSQVNQIESDLSLIDIPQMQQDLEDIHDALVALNLETDPALLIDEGWTGLSSDPKDIGAFTGIKSIDTTYVTFSGTSTFKKSLNVMVFENDGKIKYSKYVDPAKKTKQKLYLNIWTESIGVGEVDKVFYARGSVNTTTPSIAPIAHGVEILPAYHANHDEYGTLLKRTDPEFFNNLSKHNTSIDVDGNYHQLRFAIDSVIYENVPAQGINQMSYVEIFSWNNRDDVFDPNQTNQTTFEHPALEGNIYQFGYPFPADVRFITFSNQGNGELGNWSGYIFPVLATDAVTPTSTITKIWVRIPDDVWFSSGVPSNAQTVNIFYLYGDNNSNSVGVTFRTNFNQNDIFDNSYLDFAIQDLTQTLTLGWRVNTSNAASFDKVTVAASLLNNPEDVRYYLSSFRIYDRVVKVVYDNLTDSYDIWFFSTYNNGSSSIDPVNTNFITLLDSNLNIIVSEIPYTAQSSTGVTSINYYDVGSIPVIMSHDSSVLNNRVQPTIGTYQPYSTQDEIFAIRWDNVSFVSGLILADMKYLKIITFNGDWYFFPIVAFGTDGNYVNLFYRAPFNPTNPTNFEVIHNIVDQVNWTVGPNLDNGTSNISDISASINKPDIFTNASFPQFQADTNTTFDPFIINPNTPGNDNPSSAFSVAVIAGQIPIGYSSMLNQDLTRIIKITAHEYDITLDKTYIYYYDNTISHLNINDAINKGEVGIVFILDDGTTPVTRQIIQAFKNNLNTSSDVTGPAGFAITYIPNIISSAAIANHLPSTSPTIVPIINSGINSQILFRFIDKRKLLVNNLTNVLTKFDETYQLLLDGTDANLIDGTNTQYQRSKNQEESIDILVNFTLDINSDRKYIWKNIPVDLVSTVPDEIASIKQVNESNSLYKFKHSIITEVLGDGSTDIIILVYRYGGSYSSFNGGNLSKTNGIQSTMGGSLVPFNSTVIQLGSDPESVAVRESILANNTHVAIIDSSTNVEIGEIDVGNSPVGQIAVTSPLTGLFMHKLLGLNSSTYTNDIDDLELGYTYMNGSDIDVYVNELGINRNNASLNDSVSVNNEANHFQNAVGFNVEKISSGESNQNNSTSYKQLSSLVFSTNNRFYLSIIQNSWDNVYSSTDAVIWKSNVLTNANSIGAGPRYSFTFNNTNYSFNFSSFIVVDHNTTTNPINLSRVVIPSAFSYGRGFAMYQDGPLLKICVYSTDNKFYYYHYDSSFVKVAEGSFLLGSYYSISVHKREDTGVTEMYLIHTDKKSISRLISNDGISWNEFDANPIYVDTANFNSININRYHGFIIYEAQNIPMRYINLYKPYRISNYDGFEKIDTTIIKNIKNVRVVIGSDIENISKTFGEIIYNNLIPRKIGQGNIFVDISTVLDVGIIGEFVPLDNSAANSIWECVDVDATFGSSVSEVNLIDVPGFASTFYDAVPPKGIDVTGPNTDVLFPFQTKVISTNIDIVVVTILEWVDDSNNLRRSFILMYKGAGNKYNQMEAAFTYSIMTDNFIANIPL